MFGRYGVEWGVRGIIMMSGIFGPCVLTAGTTALLAFVTFGRRYGVVDIWDRRIERWMEAWEKDGRKSRQRPMSGYS
ncbi:hypothetical protein QBC45DRAFT_425489 [Copromyces sp. CBS 386.78]|nr:hypothetical protein QBC45DRAFT_425489 [Copromyces sp. CBS 386.78]